VLVLGKIANRGSKVLLVGGSRARLDGGAVDNKTSMSNKGSVTQSTFCKTGFASRGMVASTELVHVTDAGTIQLEMMDSVLPLRNWGEMFRRKGSERLAPPKHVV
jgi:hypothetical protein